jgi:MoxR-like ATPase
VVPEDIHAVAPEVLRHRVLLSYDALASGVGIEDVVQRVLQNVAEPRIAPHQDETARMAAGQDVTRSAGGGLTAQIAPPAAPYQAPRASGAA